jgi:membrane-bound serine protease (ClpP class)
MIHLIQIRIAAFTAFLILLIVLLPRVDASIATVSAAQQVDPEDGAGAETDREGYRVKVPLPIDGQVSAALRQTLKRISEKTSPAAQRRNRPVVVLEFDTRGGQTGRGSELEACMALARYLRDPDLNRLQTVAYIPQRREGLGWGTEESTASGELNGHAVLVAIAANQIAIDPDAAIGKAGIDDKTADDLYREIYRSVASRGLTTLPVSVALSMLDREQELYRVTDNDGAVSYVNGETLKQMEASGKPLTVVTVTPQGSFSLLTGKQLQDFGLVRLLPESRLELARELDLNPNVLQGDPADGGKWKPLLVNLPPFIDSRTATWVTRSLKQKLGGDEVNLVIFKLGDNLGDEEACLRIGRLIASYDSDEIRTVAFLESSVRGPAGVIALACNQLIMNEDSRLGGDYGQEELMNENELNELREEVKRLAEDKGSDWSMLMQMLEPSLVVTRYRHQKTGQIRLMCNAEFENTEQADQWAALGPMGSAEGISAVMAEQNGLARTIVSDIEQVKIFYQLDESIPTLTPSKIDRRIARFAEFLSSPFVSPWLLFGAMFFLSTEFSAPGLGVPGFLAVLCFGLFFWSQSLDGNADWLEVIMFIIGVIFIVMEIFVIPGFGVFGIGGIVLVFSSLVLASQSFLVPRSLNDMVQMTYSFVPVIGAGFGVLTAGIVLRNLIPKTPMLRRLILQPRKFVDTGLGGRMDPEAMVDWSYLQGLSGETATRLNPSGKARIQGKVYDVISNGQMLERGQGVVVIEAIGNRIVVTGEPRVKST